MPFHPGYAPLLKKYITKAADASPSESFALHLDKRGRDGAENLGVIIFGKSDKGVCYLEFRNQGALANGVQFVTVLPGATPRTGTEELSFADKSRHGMLGMITLIDQCCQLVPFARKKQAFNKNGGGGYNRGGNGGNGGGYGNQNSVPDAMGGDNSAPAPSSSSDDSFLS